MEMAFSVGGGTVFGYALDQVFDTEPTLTIVFLFAGCAGGILAFVKMWKLLKDKM